VHIVKLNRKIAQNVKTITFDLDTYDCIRIEILQNRVDTAECLL